MHYFALPPTSLQQLHSLIDGGQFVLSNGTYIGSIATYSCKEGYTLVGFEVRICQLDRKWSGLAPTCESMLHKNSELENVEHCGGEPEQAANMHMNILSFTLK